AILSSLGIVAMRDPYQRLHFISPPASLSALSVTLAVLIGEKQKQAGAKAALVAFLLYFMNSVGTHATARAHFVREKGTWPPPEPIEVVKEERGGLLPDRRLPPRRAFRHRRGAHARSPGAARRGELRRPRPGAA